MRKTLTALLALSILSACKPSTNNPFQVFYAPSLTAPCPPVPVLQDDALLDDLVAFTIDLKAQYKDCAERHRRLAATLNQK